MAAQNVPLKLNQTPFFRSQGIKHTHTRASLKFFIFLGWYSVKNTFSKKNSNGSKRCTKVMRGFFRSSDKTILMTGSSYDSPVEDWCVTESERPDVVVGAPSVDRDFWKFKFRFNNRPQVATLILSCSGRGILLPCCRKIFFWRRNFGLRVIIGFKNLI